MTLKEKRDTLQVQVRVTFKQASYVGNAGNGLASINQFTPCNL
jgi:hypothetical protein